MVDARFASRSQAEHTAPDPRRRAWRFALAASVLLVSAVIGYAWYVSDRIASGALEPANGTPARHLEVLSVGNGVVVLRDGGDSNAHAPGVWGLEWGEGRERYAQVGSPLPTGDRTAEVTRPLIEGWPKPEVGASARVDDAAFPVDPSSRGIPFTLVTYPAPEGDTPAWLVPGPSSTWVIFVHGKAGSRRGVLRMLPAVVDAGMPCLVIAYRNDPEAPGGARYQYRYGIEEWRDLEAAVAYARVQGAQDIVIAGSSMGGAITMAFMRESPLAKDVRALVLDSPMLDFRATVRANLEAAGLPAVFVPLPMWIAAKRFDLDWGGLDYSDEATALQVPLLLFHGTADPIVPVELSDALARARPDIVEYHRTEGAQHTGSWTLDGAAYEEAVRSFLVRVSQN